MTEKLQVGERFEIGNADKPEWARGWFEVTAVFQASGRIICKRVEGPRK